MNWIDFKKERPKEEPVREILLMFPNGTKGVRLTSTLSHWTADDATHWSEIDPPPKPDPFEEAFGRIIRMAAVSHFTNAAIARLVWDAAIKWKEGK